MNRKFICIFCLCLIFMGSSCNNSPKEEDKIPPEVAVDSAKMQVDTAEVGIVKKPIKLTRKDSSKCADIVLQILESSTAYKNLTKGLKQRIRKNGGKGFHLYLSASPNPTVDGADKFSEEYEYSLHESYKDREPRLAGFKFSPKDRLLYLEDIVEGEYKPIPFNEQLLLKLPTECK